MRVEIRRAAGIDADVLVAMACRFNAEDGHPLPPAGVEALVAMLEPGFRQGAILLLEVDGGPAGYGILSYGYGIEHGGPEAFVEDLFVVPERRGCGLGTRLLDRLERHAAAAGIRALRLEVMPGNRAGRLYRRLGYRNRGSALLTKPL